MAVLLANPAKSIGKFLTYSSIPEISCTAAGDNIVIDGKKRFSVQAEKFPYQSFDPVSDNGIPHFPADRDTDTRPGKRGTRINNDEIRQIQLPAPSSYRDKFRPFPKPNGFVKCWHCRGKCYLEAMETERRFLPFALRRLITRRPFFVAMRTKKP